MKNLSDIVPGLDVPVDTTLETKPSSFGKYTKVATGKDGQGSLWVNIVWGPYPRKEVSPTGDEKLLPVFAAAVRIRIYGGSMSNNPFPSFKVAQWDGSNNEAPYWKVKQFFMLTRCENGLRQFAEFYKSTFGPDLCKALKEAVEADGGTLCVEEGTLQNLIDAPADDIPLSSNTGVYQPPQFASSSGLE